MVVFMASPSFHSGHKQRRPESFLLHRHTGRGQQRSKAGGSFLLLDKKCGQVYMLCPGLCPQQLCVLANTPNLSDSLRLESLCGLEAMDVGAQAWQPVNVLQLL